MRFFRKDEGFTLVELMVVVLIIGILIAIAVPVFNTARANAQKRSCQATQRTFEGAYQTFLADDPANFGTVTDYTTAMAKLVPNFVKAAPACPAGTTAYTVTMLNTNQSLDLVCNVTGVTAHNTY